MWQFLGYLKEGARETGTLPRMVACRNGRRGRAEYNVRDRLPVLLPLAVTGGEHGNIPLIIMPVHAQGGQ
jgi:hypothetical protein